MCAIAMLWIEDDLLVRFNRLDDVQFDADLLRRPKRIVAFSPVFIAISDRVGMAFDTKARKYVEPFHMNVLLKHNSGGQH